jgi:hypothetical protein
VGLNCTPPHIHVEVLTSFGNWVFLDIISVLIRERRVTERGRERKERREKKSQTHTGSVVM